MADFINYKVGLGSTGQYQMSGIPFAKKPFEVSGSNDPVVEIEFPRVTKFITVINAVSGASAPLRFGFSANGVSGSGAEEYIILDNGESYTGEFRVTSIYLIGDTTTHTSASIIAGLTGIPTSSLPPDWHNWSGSIGVG